LEVDVEAYRCVALSRRVCESRHESILVPRIVSESDAPDPPWVGCGRVTNQLPCVVSRTIVNEHDEATVTATFFIMKLLEEL
jgi:hypothetical protein